MIFIWMNAPAHLLNWTCVEIASSTAITTECQFKPNVHFTILDLFQAAAHCFMSDKQTVCIECNPKHTLIYKMTKNHLIGRGPREFTHSHSWELPSTLPQSYTVVTSVKLCSNTLTGGAMRCFRQSVLAFEPQASKSRASTSSAGCCLLHQTTSKRAKTFDPSIPGRSQVLKQIKIIFIT